MECLTVCTRCELKWDGDFEYCLNCEPRLARSERIEACDVCQDRKAIAVPGDDYACRKHQAMIDSEGEKHATMQF
jgi:hypothetical protein